MRGARKSRSKKSSLEIRRGDQVALRGQDQLTAKRGVTNRELVETPMGIDGGSAFQPLVMGWGHHWSAESVVRKKS